MANPRSYDAIVIGGDFNGLAAAALLARAGKKVLVLEARDRFGGMASASDSGLAPASQTLHALDPNLVKQLGLARRGFQLAVRDMPLVGLRADGKHVCIRRDVRATAANIAIHSKHDAEAWPRFHRDLFALGRAMRPFWNGESNVIGPDTRDAFDRLSRFGVISWLDSWFESDALKATLAFDAAGSGLSLTEPGSTLALVWRASQEVGGLQGAVAQPRGGMRVLTEIMTASAHNAGVDMRTNVKVEDLILEGARVTGVETSAGEAVHSSTVLSTLSRQQTLSRLPNPLAAGIADAMKMRRADAPLAMARIVFSLSAAPVFSGITVPPNSRFVLSEHAESYVDAEMAARKASLASELPMEIVVQSPADENSQSQHILYVTIPFVPRILDGGWKAARKTLAEYVIVAISRYIGKFANSIASMKILTPDELLSASSFHLFAAPRDLIATPIGGLFLCGADAEPMDAVSGRAARIAASMVASGSAKL